MKRLPDFHSNVDADNYSPQVEKLLMEREWDRAVVTTREPSPKRVNRRAPIDAGQRIPKRREAS